MSLDDCTFMLKSFVVIMGLTVPPPSGHHSKNPASTLYQTMPPILDLLSVHPRSEAYVCCPTCFYLHWIDPKAPESQIPEFCQNREFGRPCGTRLKKKRKTRGGVKSVPIRTFRFQDPTEYLGRLFSRPDLQDFLYTDPTTLTKDNRSTWDVWDAAALRNFKGPDGKPFRKVKKGESRLIFSLNMDGFNPYGNREAGKKVSVSAIYMVCLNLPPALRYNLENMYLVGVIPGPESPSQDEINYLLRPLVKAFLALWNPGVHLTRTHRHPEGYNVRCAIVPLICDLPASRQMSGFGHYRSKHFCSECHQQLDDINDLDYTNWEPRTLSDHLSRARSWKNAPTLEQRERCANLHGIRWSELLRLPYWDVTRFTLIDSMHAFYLRMFQHHIRSVWGMDVNFEDGLGITYDRTQGPPTEVEMKHANHVLRHGSNSTLKALRVPILRELCRMTSSLNFRGKKALLLNRLIEYRVRQGWFDYDGNHLGNPGDDHVTAVPSPEPVLIEVLSTGQTLDDFWHNASKSRVEQSTRKVDLLFVFRRKVLPTLEAVTEAEIEKFRCKDLRGYIQNERKAQKIIDSEGKVIGAVHRKTRVLGRHTLAEIRRDMKRIEIPTWQAQAPKRPGEKKFGKFTADQWRTFCLINLPITLVRLWGHFPDNSLERRRLENFMDLVSAVKLATMHKLDENRIRQYEVHMHRYLVTLLELYPGTRITPYQHLALHFGRQLRDFGPVHAWRCFPFERYNFILQSTPNNNKFGEMECTMFSRFCSAQNIRAIFQSGAIPGPIKALVEIYNKRYSKDFRGTRINDVLTHDERFRVTDANLAWDDTRVKFLDSATFSLLQQWVFANDPSSGPISRKGLTHTFVYRLGQRFTTASFCASDCHVVYGDRSGNRWKVGAVESIFSHKRTSRGLSVSNTFAIVNEYEELPPELVTQDHYRDFVVAGGKMVENKFKKKRVLVEFSQIECHFASCLQLHGGLEVLVALPLDKV